MAPARSLKRRTTTLLQKFPTCLSIILVLFLGPIAPLLHGSEAGSGVIRDYRESEQRPRYSELFAAYGHNKVLPEGYELQALLALSHYPELRAIKIRFIVDNVSIPLSSRPHWASMLLSARNRTYLVIIDNDHAGPRDALLVKNQPFNAQVGIIGHELAHTVYYLNRSFFGILADAACQLTDCRIEFERTTDRRLIDYGLGWQRYDHAMFVRERFGAPLQDASNMDGGSGAYMSPAELLSLIESNVIYADQGVRTN